MRAKVLAMGSYVPKLELKRKFAHEDGREVWVWRDHAKDNWIVEIRPPRTRYVPQSEPELDAVLARMMEDDAWSEPGRRKLKPPWA
jgi:hypothetical protein